MIVEFVGPPGAGKTTTAREVGQRLTNARLYPGLRRFPVRGRRLHGPQRDGQRLLTLVSHPTIGRHLAGVRSRAQFELLARLARYEQYRRRLASEAGVVLLEEGPLLGLATLGAEGGQVVPTRAITPPDLVVHVTAPAEVCRQRIRQRRANRSFDVQSDGALLDLLQRYVDAVDAAVAGTDAPVCRVDTTSGGAVDTVVTAVRRCGADD